MESLLVVEEDEDINTTYLQDQVEAEDEEMQVTLGHEVDVQLDSETAEEPLITDELHEVEEDIVVQDVLDEGVEVVEVDDADIMLAHSYDIIVGYEVVEAEEDIEDIYTHECVVEENEDEVAVEADRLPLLVEVDEEDEEMQVLTDDEHEREEQLQLNIQQTEVTESSLLLDEIVAILVIEIVYISLHQTEHLLLLDKMPETLVIRIDG